VNAPVPDERLNLSAAARRATKPSDAAAVHFGLEVRSGRKYGLRIDRDTYAVINKRSSFYWKREVNPRLWDAIAEDYEDEDHRFLTDEWCERQREDALANFDLNMAYFASLDTTEFNDAVDSAVAAQRGMHVVHDLNEWKGKRGLYVMVLDRFRQVYVGVTESEGGVLKRIQQHWTQSKQFDRLLWGGVNESILSIDSFRALDTTRIFAARVRDPFALEHKVIESLPSKFVLNRTFGGRGNLVGFASALGANIVKTHELDSDAR
jgi:hypothetical protein